ncbi:tripartite tricarboxylate transporter substrate binding protein [Propionivibrio dicarboxylicus]|uniref:Tripartite-type tricarboxylate transporter, receptor component TctC n=1 Tax=Propionivibrio dicarboxylicus TaxID=83767 RepID=A0A1G8IZW5_9RHOO|nr:tripartite tricarboxylate transporter substrate binding protein [Propionivibrio dicarboxylicus]SDI24396.1 Tripartite-type tricarboxylate transporter, receptor component TctC [Propionivibrio dicarboxylicus]
MRDFNRREILKAATACVAVDLLGIGNLAHAQSAGTAKIIVPYAPGAATDMLARMMAQHLQQTLGVVHIVDNKGGAGTRIGTKAIADATPDGMTLGFIDTAFVINPALFGSALPYDTVKNFAPLSLMATAPLVLSVHSSVPANTLKELIDLAKAKPGKYSYCSAGVASAPHLASEQLRAATGADVIHVPYKGGNSALTDLVGGHVAFGFTTVPSMLQHIRSGAVRALAVTGATRSAQLPNVPSMAELGLPSVDATPLFGLIAPAQVPKTILDKISGIASVAVRSGPLQGKLVEQGFIPVGSTASEFKAKIESEIAKWTKVVKAADIKPEA